MPKEASTPGLVEKQAERFCAELFSGEILSPVEDGRARREFYNRFVLLPTRSKGSRSPLYESHDQQEGSKPEIFFSRFVPHFLFDLRSGEITP